jgi:hypothetical protein
MQSIKEKKLLVKFAMQMGQHVDSLLVEEIKRYEEQQAALKESVSKAAREIFEPATKVLPHYEADEGALTEAQIGQIKNPDPALTTESEPLPKPDLIAKSVQAIHKAEKELKENSFQQPSVPEPTDLREVKQKIKFLEQWVGKISATGPGGGAGDISTLSQQTVSVTSASYTAGRKDYYIGVNYAGKVTVYLPASPAPGRSVIVKDESGNCGAGINRWITIRTNDGLYIDGKNAANLAIDWGSLTFVNRNGWRIV